MSVAFVIIHLVITEVDFSIVCLTFVFVDAQFSM